MTAPAVFTRHRTIVEAMRIVPTADEKRQAHDGTLEEAQEWLARRGVHSIRLGDWMHILGPHVRLPLHVGQWLIRDVNLGDFTVSDDLDFRALHAPHDADDLEALMRAVQ